MRSKATKSKQDKVDAKILKAAVVNAKDFISWEKIKKEIFRGKQRKRKT